MSLVVVEVNDLPRLLNYYHISCCFIRSFSMVTDSFHLSTGITFYL